MRLVPKRSVQNNYLQSALQSAEDNLEATRVRPGPCPQLPGTLVRIFIPAGAVINLLNLIEITSPSGICLIIRIPILGGGNTNIFSALTPTITSTGGNVEVLE